MGESRGVHACAIKFNIIPYMTIIKTDLLVPIICFKLYSQSDNSLSHYLEWGTVTAIPT